MRTQLVYRCICRTLEVLCLASYFLGLLSIVTNGLETSVGSLTLSIHSPGRSFIMAIVFLVARLLIDPRIRKRAAGEQRGSDHQHPWYVTAGFLLLGALLFFIFQARFISDDCYYYDYLRSLFFDSDLSFLNERAIHHPSWVWIREASLVRPTATGYVDNVFAAGASLLWLPFFLLGHGCAKIIQLTGGKLVLDGYSTPYLSLLCGGSIAYAFSGLILTYRMCRRLVSEKWGFIAVLFVFFGSPLFYYTFYDPGYSHGMSFFATALFINLWLRQHSRPDMWGAIFLGLAGGVMTFVRWQNLLFFIIPALDWMMLVVNELRTTRHAKKMVSVTLHILLSALSALIVFLPQMVIFKVLSGSFFNPGSSVVQHLSSPKIFEVLFSSWHGLFTWSPVLLLAFAGFLCFVYKRHRLGIPLLVALLLQIYINATVTDWWGGGGFGMRRMCSTLPIFALGLTVLLKEVSSRSRRWILIGGCLIAVGWNWFLITYHLTRNFVGNPKIHPAMFAPELWPHYGQSLLGIFKSAIGFPPAAWPFLPLFVGFLALCLHLILRGERVSGVTFKAVLTLMVVLGVVVLANYLWTTGHQVRTIEVLEIGDSKQFGKLVPFKIGNQAVYQGSYKEWRVTSTEPFRASLRGKPTLPILSIISHCESARARERGTTVATVTLLGKDGQHIVFPLRRGIETDDSCADPYHFEETTPTAAIPVLRSTSAQCEQPARRFGARFQLPPELEIASISVTKPADREDSVLVLSGLCFEDRQEGTITTALNVPAIIRVPADQPTIQRGIDQAVPGDTVLIADGVYRGAGNTNLDLRGKAIRVVSECGPESCIIDCRQEGRGFQFKSNEDRTSVVQGLTIRGGNPQSGEGGGIFIENASPTIKDCLISGNNARVSGGGIFCSVSSPLISGCRIEGNRVASNGGGLFCAHSSPAISSTLFRDNSAESTGGAAFCRSNASPIFEDCQFERNSAGEKGGALGGSGMRAAVLRNTLLLSNRAPAGGGVYCSRSSLSISSSTFSENWAEQGGALFCTAESSLSVTNTILYGDEAERGAEVCIADPRAINRFSIAYCDLAGGREAMDFSPRDHVDWGPGMIDADPLFSSGSWGDHFLGQTICGQLADSPSLDGGIPAGTRIEGTTRTDLAPDHGLPDLGYHYPVSPRLVLAPGPGNNPPLIRLFSPMDQERYLREFCARGVPHRGAGVVCGDIDGDLADEILVSAGASPLCPPRVQGFRMDGSPVPGVDFLAYPTAKWGVNVATGDLDGDGAAEIITGPGPGPKLGPQVKAFRYDSDCRVKPLSDIFFFAFDHRGWGVNVAAGDLDGDGFAEIVTGCGPGPAHKAEVRGWNVDGAAVEALPGLIFTAADKPGYGVVVCCGDLDGDGIDEIITAPGPHKQLGAHIRGWKYDGSTVRQLSAFDFYAWPSPQFGFGATLSSGTDLNGNGRDELLVGAGPGPELESLVNIYGYDGTAVEMLSSFSGFASGMTHGVNVAAGIENVMAGRRPATQRGGPRVR